MDGVTEREGDRLAVVLGLGEGLQDKQTSYKTKVVSGCAKDSHVAMYSVPGLKVLLIG